MDTRGINPIPRLYIRFDRRAFFEFIGARAARLLQKYQKKTHSVETHITTGKDLYLLKSFHAPSIVHISY